MNFNEIGISFLDKLVPLFNAFVSVIVLAAAPFINQFYPPLNEFVPEPEAPPTAVEKHSIAGYKILYDGAGPATDKTAAEILADTLNRITGGSEFTAEVASAPTSENAFLIGALVSGADVSQLGADGYLIKADGSDITIAGGQRGVIYGVYHFLEEYFGCRWYTSALQAIPSGPAEIAQVKPERYAPPFEYRETDWISPHDPVYSMANGLNGTIYRSLSAAQGGTFGYNGYFAHTIINQFLRPDEFFSDHPEWYAWRDLDMKRVPKQLCLTNPEVLAEMIREVRALLANGNGQPIVSVTQDDNEIYCQCRECRRVDAQEGSHAGTMLRFVNAIAADIAGDYPDALIDTFAYQYTRTPSKITKPQPNVIVRLCSIECCFAHPLDDPNCPDNVPFARDIKTWSELCDRLYIWDYTTNFLCSNCVFPDFQVLQKNMQFFVRHNVKGVYEEGNYLAAESDSEFAELRAYLLSRLLFNPDLDYDAEMNGFLKGYYGGGWQYMREFINLISANTGKPALFGVAHRQLKLWIPPASKSLLDLKPNQIAYVDALWAKAIELAGSETCQHNVLRSQLSWRFWKGCNRAGEFNWWLLPNEQWQAANEQLYNDFKAFGITRYKEGVSWNDSDEYAWRFLPEPPGNWWETPESWRG